MAIMQVARTATAAWAKLIFCDQHDQEWQEGSVTGCCIMKGNTYVVWFDEHSLWQTTQLKYWDRCGPDPLFAAMDNLG